MVSVCIATHNGERYIFQQLKSILDQLSEDDEVIISDDASTDGTIEIIRGFCDKRVRLLFHEPNMELSRLRLGGYRMVAANFHNALLECKGDYVFLSDQDDIWMENRLTKVLAALQNNTVVLCNYQIIDSDGNEKGKLGYNSNEYPVSNSFVYNVLRSRFMCCCMAFRSEVLKYIIPFPKRLMSCDQWIGDIATLLGNCKYIDEPLHKYRRHGMNVSETSEKSKNSLFFKVYFRLYILIITLFRVIKIKLS